MADDDLLDARQAAELLQRSADHARQRLMVNQPLIYGAWGAAWLIGCGAMWLSVLGAGIALAIVATAITTSRASKGIGGVSARQGMMYGLSWPVGFAALFTLIGAATHFGASPTVLGVLGAAGPLVVVGLIYMVAAGMWLDWIMFWRS